MDTIKFTKLEVAYLLDKLDAEAMIIQQYTGADPIARIENEEELKMLNAICDRLSHTM